MIMNRVWAEDDVYHFETMSCLIWAIESAVTFIGSRQLGDYNIREGCRGTWYVKTFNMSIIILQNKIAVAFEMIPIESL